MKTLNTTHILFLAFSLLSCTVNANVSIDSRENKAIARAVIEAPADKVWAEIGRIDGIENFVPTVFKKTSKKGTGLGATRICEHHDGNELVEKIIAFDATSMTLSYTLISGGDMWPIENIHNTVQVHPISETRSLLTWVSKYDDKTESTNPKMMREFTQNGLSMVAAGVKRYIEGLK